MTRGPIISLLLFACAALLVACDREPVAKPTTAPAATQAATAPATKPFVARSYIDLIRKNFPKIATTQPLGVPVDLDDAAHFVLAAPIYLCPRGDLWITSAAARPASDVLRLAPDEQTHVIAEQVVYVHWAADERGKWVPRIVVRAMEGEGFETFDSAARKRVGDPHRAYRWNDAISSGDRVIVPTDRGVSIFTFGPPSADITESYHELIGSTADGGPPQFVLDPRGVLAWSPADDEKLGSNGAVRFVDGKWEELTPEKNWPAKILHLVPLLDGSVLQIALDDANKVKLTLAPLDTGNIDEKAITDLVEQLSDVDNVKRDAAFAQLTRYGPPSWPLLEKLLPDQSPEAQSRLRQLLRDRTEPSLGGRNLVDGKMRVADRFADGGVLFYADAGVSITRENRPPLIVSPAWISIRPGRAIELLEPVLTRDASPEKQHFFAFGDEWIVGDTVRGPRRLAGNHLESMLNKNESAWATVIGMDRRGRWLFEKSASGGAAATTSATSAPAVHQTLLLDPTIPDPTPKLPVWEMPVVKGVVGWNRKDYPVIKRGGAWVLKEETWEPLDERSDAMITSLPASAKPPPSTNPATQPILQTKDGTKYFDGATTLRIVTPADRETIWPLPANAAGRGKVTLIRISDGRLFLFNQPGRVVRLKPAPASTQPFEVEAVFTHAIPNVDDPTRIWLDPAGRIVIAYDKNKLAILFPEGRIPQPIQYLMLENPKN